MKYRDVMEHQFGEHLYIAHKFIDRMKLQNVSISIAPWGAILDVEGGVILRHKLQNGRPPVSFRTVTGSFDVSMNPITSYDFFPQSIGKPGIDSYLDLSVTNIVSLEGIHEHVRECHGYIHLDNSHIDSNILGLLLIKGLMGVTFDKWDRHRKAAEIINKHLAGDRDVLACQDEMIDAGCGKLAQL